MVYYKTALLILIVLIPLRSTIVASVADEKKRKKATIK